MNSSHLACCLYKNIFIILISFATQSPRSVPNLTACIVPEQFTIRVAALQQQFFSRNGISDVNRQRQIENDDRSYVVCTHFYMLMDRHSRSSSSPPCHFDKFSYITRLSGNRVYFSRFARCLTRKASPPQDFHCHYPQTRVLNVNTHSTSNMRREKSEIIHLWQSAIRNKLSRKHTAEDGSETAKLVKWIMSQERRD